MPSLQEQRRNLIVQFVRRWKHRRIDWKKMTAHHFMDQGIPKSTIYEILDRLERTGSVVRKRGSGRKAVKMDRRKREALRRAVDHKTGISQRELAVRFGCNQSYISRTIRRLKIMCRKRVKVPKYKDDAAIREARKRCRKLYNLYKTLDFVIDDEKYFGLTGFQMSGNRNYYSSNRDRTPSSVATYSKKKFEPKVMLWIAISPKGLSTPVLTSGRSMSVTSSTYITRCLNPVLVPFLQEKYPNGGYIFWPDKASSHYARATCSFLDGRGVNYVPKDVNPTEVPQCRPIEDFFGVLAGHVYRKNWVARDTEALKRRIRTCIWRISPETVQVTAQAVRKRLLKAYRLGIFKVCH